MGTRTKLIISMAGSSIMNAFLFQNEAALFCYCQKGRRPDSSTIFKNGTMFQLSNEFKLWFDHFTYGKFFQICQKPDMMLSGEDVIINVDRLYKRMQGLKL